jgi:hypothetical protein
MREPATRRGRHAMFLKSFVKRGECASEVLVDRPTLKSRLASGVACIVAIGCTCAGGCYDSKSLVDQVRNQAIRTRLEEVSLGQFRTTLPRFAVNDAPMEVVVDLFGTAVRHKIPEIEKLLAANEYRFRQAVLVAIRETTAEEIADPDLKTLRKRLFEVVNSELPDTPVEAVGFREIRFIPL